MRRRHLAALFSAAMLPTLAARAQPQATGTIRMVVPFPPGGASDVIGRIVAEQMRDRLGMPVVVDNRAGASGNIGADIVAKARPDGLTLLLASASTHGINPTLMASMPFDSRRDFTPVSLVVMVPTILVVTASLPVRNVDELIAHARANPGKLNYGSVGNGTTQHLAGVMLRERTGVDMVHVPYRGQNLLIPELTTGQIHLVFNNIAAVRAGIEAGQLRALAVALPERWPTLPNVPTFAEAGLRDFQVSSWLALLGPAGMAAGTAESYAAAVRAAVADRDVRARLIQAGGLPIGSTPAETERFIHNEIGSWGRVVRAAGVRVE
ncbi:MAG TPA: tripartite tricarboxylate transporter substrate binding protein [Falsiroseomonas sp.]|nr:tripartite tricarboxylate transporter substrate binding protein [Falsiroseomonas sp.]